jgi:hypothetical protein
MSDQLDLFAGDVAPEAPEAAAPVDFVCLINGREFRPNPGPAGDFRDFAAYQRVAAASGGRLAIATNLSPALQAALEDA